MRGFPLINAAIILVALGVILVPLVKLTSAPPTVIADRPLLQTETEDPNSVSVSLSFRSAHTPDSIKVSHLGKLLVNTDSVDDIIDVDLMIPEEGVDLLVDVQWPNGTPETALELTLEPTARDSLAQVLWGEGQVEEILTFVWQP